MMHRFYLQIYFTFLVILLIFGVLVSLAWLSRMGSSEDLNALDRTGALFGELLPAADRPRQELQASLERVAKQLPAHLALWAADGTLLASVGDPLPAPPPDQGRSGWMPAGGAGATAALVLPDGRWVVARWRHKHRPWGWLSLLLLLAVAVAVGAYPVVRRITRRLERLQRRADALAAGELSSRVEVEGNDEIADLARSFNRATDLIEKLVNAQRSVLAGVSHELRSPLARMRMAVELLSQDNRPELRRRLSQDIAELDELISELLLASRLDALDHLEHSEEVDLLGLLAEEAALAQAEVSGRPISIHGDARMLRRLIRNLLENARRHAGGTPIETSVVPLEDSGARLCVEDGGPGVEEGERERIFEPFYRAGAATEGNEAGVGLGLALVRQIARHHQGEVRCLPRPGGGTRFEVDLRVS